MRFWRSSVLRCLLPSQVAVVHLLAHDPADAGTLLRQMIVLSDRKPTQEPISPSAGKGTQFVDRKPDRLCRRDRTPDVPDISPWGNIRSCVNVNPVIHSDFFGCQIDSPASSVPVLAINAAGGIDREELSDHSLLKFPLPIPCILTSHPGMGILRCFSPEIFLLKIHIHFFKIFGMMLTSFQPFYFHGDLFPFHSLFSCAKIYQIAGT